MGSLVRRFSDGVICRAFGAVEYAPTALFHPTTTSVREPRSTRAFGSRPSPFEARHYATCRSMVSGVESAGHPG